MQTRAEDPFDRCRSRYDEINERLKQFATLCNQNQRVADDYRTFYENRVVEVANVAARALQDARDERLHSEVRSMDKLRETLRLIGIMQRELAGKKRSG